MLGVFKIKYKLAGKLIGEKILKVGIIGGSGLDDPDILKDPNEFEISTEYGNPSSSLLSGKINNVKTIILARHGKNHQFSPTQVNNRANIKALQKTGVNHIIATTACGSLRQKIDGDIWSF